MKELAAAEWKSKIRDLEEEIKLLRSREDEYKKLEEQLQLSQKMEAMAVLAGGIAHDFNNILQTILGTTELLLIRKPEDHPERKKLLQIQTAANKASELSHQFITIGKKPENKYHSLDLNTRIKDLIKLLARTFPKMIAVELRLQDDLKRIRMDAGKIDQIIVNLAINARDAMPDGGKLIFKTEAATLNSGLHCAGLGSEFALLTVTDTGLGMPAEIVEHIFEPFYTTKAPGKGTGLGLPTVKTILEDNGGFIKCSSTHDKGTSFYIYFPVADSSKTIPDEYEKAGGEHSLNGHETILLVDDDSAILDIEQEMLKWYNYKIITAKSGEEAIAKYSNSPVDVVILDIGMPGMGGIECLKELLSIDNKAKIVISSGYSMNGRANNALSSGAFAFVPKPYHLKEILRTIREIMDRKQENAVCL